MIAYVDSNGTYFGLIAGIGGPKTLHYGHRFNPICPESAWTEILKQKAVKPAGFTCNRCQAPALINRKGRTQLCRCARVRCEPGHEFKTAEEWEAWQDDFDEQLKDPAPKDYWVEPKPDSEGGPQGKEKVMTPEAKTWLKRKLGLPAQLELSDNGNTIQLPGTRGALSISSRGNLTAVDLPDNKDGLQLFLAAQQIQTARECLPQVILVLGDDDDYVWPPWTNHRLIRGLPYNCSHCGRRVRQAPVGTGQILTCLCLQAVYPPGTDKRTPRDRQGWDTLRLEVTAETTRLRAQTAGTEN